MQEWSREVGWRAIDRQKIPQPSKDIRKLMAEIKDRENYLKEKKSRENRN